MMQIDMKRKLLFMFSGCLIALLSTLPACNGTDQEETKPTDLTSSPTITSETTTPGNVDYSTQGWTEDDIRLWEERGAANADSAEVASNIAGFKVVTPGFIPESLRPVSKYMIQDHSAGLRSAGMEPKFEWIDVTLLYAIEGEKEPTLTFIQSTRKFNAGLGEQVEICGRTVEKESFPVEPESGVTEPGLAFGWEHNDI